MADQVKFAGSFDVHADALYDSGRMPSHSSRRRADPPPVGIRQSRQRQTRMIDRISAVGGAGPGRGDRDG